MNFARLCTRFCAVTLVSLVGTSPSRAGFLVEDKFSYGNNVNLAGQNGGTGWGGAWASAGGTAKVVQNALQLSGNDNNIAKRSLGSTITGTQNVFVSFLLSSVGKDKVGDSSGSFLGLWFGPSAGDHTSVPNFGLRTTSGSGNDLFARQSGTGATYAPNSNVVNGKTYLLVAELVSNGSMFVGMKFGVNPTSEASLSTVISGALNLTSFSQIGFRTAYLSHKAILQVDNLRITDDFKTAIGKPPGVATPAPPAVLLALGGLPFLSLAARRAARRKQEIATA
jgi:hypothetical protein